jgi:hypothetical protein
MYCWRCQCGYLLRTYCLPGSPRSYIVASTDKVSRFWLKTKPDTVVVCEKCQRRHEVRFDDDEWAAVQNGRVPKNEG